VYDIFYQNEIQGVAQPPAPGPVPAGFIYEFEHGQMRVAEDEVGRLIGFGATLSWDGPYEPLTYLSDLFIAQDVQSQGVGQAILRELPLSEGPRCVNASADPRASALYIRWGMYPRWPSYGLLIDPQRIADGLRALPGVDIEIIEADPADPEVAAWDVRSFGYARPRDLAWLQVERGARPLWFRRAGKTIGYGFVQWRAASMWRPNSSVIGPIGAETTEEAHDCVCAAARWVGERGVARVVLPGPHPALPTLVKAGLHIVYNEMFLASPGAPRFDPTRYLPSGMFL